MNVGIDYLEEDLTHAISPFNHKVLPRFEATWIGI